MLCALIWRGPPFLPRPDQHLAMGLGFTISSWCCSAALHCATFMNQLLDIFVLREIGALEESSAGPISVCRWEEMWGGRGSWGHCCVLCSEL